MSNRRDSVSSSSNKLQVPKTKGRSKSDSQVQPDKPTRKPLSDLSNELTPVRAHKGFLESLLTSAVRNCHPDAKPFIKDFKTRKEELTKLLYKFYNKTVFANVLPADMDVVWNVRLTKTAGNCYYDYDSKNRHSSYIHLSVKVLDTPDRLCRTLVHEMCHAAVWMVDGDQDGHGPLWRAWTEKAEDLLPELPEITTFHDYEIRTRYTYKCQKCKDEIGRHSKSIDTTKMECGSIKENGMTCRGKFQLIVNKGFTPVKRKVRKAGQLHKEVLDDLSLRFCAARI